VDLKLQAAPAHISGHDLYSLMSNIVNNAVEACAAVPTAAERYIRLIISAQEPYFNIYCENSKYGETVSVNGQIPTTKTEAGHGYGLRTMERIVEAHDGLMEVTHDGRTFTLKVMLKDR
jgi:sensor histidine kinase regulating citrate/malate metabolism